MQNKAISSNSFGRRQNDKVTPGYMGEMSPGHWGVATDRGYMDTDSVYCSSVISQ